jgi:adenine-specific DNA-methyltransferase
MSESEIRDKYPNAYKWLKETEDIHRKKDNKSTNDEFWYRYARNQGVDYVELPKLSSMEICANHPNVIFNQDNFYHPTTVYSWVKKEETKESYEYLLAIANSKLLWWFLKTTGDTLQGDARRFKTNYLNPFPLPEKVSEEAEKQIADKVKEVLAIKKQNPSADTTDLENQIDQLVYQLYGLTEEEIKIIENN